MDLNQKVVLNSRETKLIELRNKVLEFYRECSLVDISKSNAEIITKWGIITEKYLPQFRGLFAGINEEYSKFFESYD